jgi:hypothetical protein
MTSTAEKQFLITAAELKEMSTSKNPDAKQEILINVLARPYVKQSPFSMMVNGFLDLVADIVISIMKYCEGK